jgi:hypothetical protein
MRHLKVFVLALLLACAPALWSAFVAVYGVWVPMPNGNGNQGAQTYLINAATHKYASCGVVTKTCTLNTAGFKLSTVNTGDTLKVSFQDIDTTTGDPDGVIDQYGTVAITAGTDDNKWIDGTTSPALGSITSGGNGSGSGRSVTIGDTVCLVREFNSFVAGSMYFLRYESQLNGWDPQMTVYDDGYNGTSWDKKAETPSFGLGCDDGTWQFMEGVSPFTATMQTISYNSGSAADEIALRFKFPFKTKLGGVRFWTNLAGDADVVLYSGTTALATVSLDNNVRRTTNAVYTNAQFQDYTLDADTVYRVALKPTTGTNIVLNYNNVQSNPIFDIVGGGRELYWSSRVDAGSWTDTTTRRPFISLNLVAFDSGAGSGAGGPSGYIAHVNPQYLPFFSRLIFPYVPHF